MVIAFLMMLIIILPSVASWAVLVLSKLPWPKVLNRYQLTREWEWRYVFSSLKSYNLIIENFPQKVRFGADNMIYNTGDCR